MKLSDPLTAIKGIGKVRASLFAKLGICDIGALIYHYPRTYTEYPKVTTRLIDIDNKSIVALYGKLIKRPVVKRTRVGSVTTAYLLCYNEKIDLVWFNLPHISKSLNDGGEFVYFGRIIKSSTHSYKMEQPIVFKKEKYDNLIGHPMPVYPLTKNLNNNIVKDAIYIAFKNLHDNQIGEYLTEEYLKENELFGAKEALYKIHFPKNYDELKAARKRLVFDEFFNFFMRINASKTAGENIKNTYIFDKSDESDSAIDKLPFKLTKGQYECIMQIRSDLCGEFVTQRMVQADVGSGKTVIAFLSMLFCAENGYKSAIMAPTEVLATQHYKTFLKFIKLMGIKYEAILLTGKMNAKEKKSAKEKLNINGPAFVIGTHALIQEAITINDLAFCVVDEQHRFGVKQRKTLSEKGNTPFSLVMSATPIPRSLAMILYGDMNITVIKDVPKKRLPIKNCVLRENMRTKAYQFLINEVNKGHQAYIICPLVDASEKTEAENVTEYYEKIQKLFPKNVKIAMLHGRMDPNKKNNIMTDFSEKKYDILISTTVIEVGIDVPNSTVMLIENAGRFGLSQLHQLRGRVGRGDAQSYCIFMDDAKDGKENQRLKVISTSNDGFYIANEDLKLRGPGELYGLRQSGGLGFVLGDIYTDSDILAQAKKHCELYLNDKGLMSLWKEGLCQERLSWNNWYNI